MRLLLGLLTLVNPVGTEGVKNMGCLLVDLLVFSCFEANIYPGEK